MNDIVLNSLLIFYGGMILLTFSAGAYMLYKGIKKQYTKLKIRHRRRKFRVIK